MNNFHRFLLTIILGLLLYGIVFSFTYGVTVGTFKFPPYELFNNIYDEIWQALVVLLPVKSVGVMGDLRTYEKTAVVRAITSVDGMTADWYPMDYKILGKISNRIMNEVKGINRVVYDISSKPPSTIEWE